MRLLVPGCKPKEPIDSPLCVRAFVRACVRHRLSWEPFDEIFSNLVCRCLPANKSSLQTLIFDFGIFRIFWPKKQQKLTKNEENCQNPNCLINFSEIWYVDSSQQKKMLQKTISRFRHFLGFFGKEIAKLTKNEENWQNPNRLIKFSEN